MKRKENLKMKKKEKKELLLKFIQEKKKVKSFKKPLVLSTEKPKYKILPEKKVTPSHVIGKPAKQLGSNRRKERKEKILEFLNRKKEEKEKLLAIAYLKKQGKRKPKEILEEKKPIISIPTAPISEKEISTHLQNILKEVKKEKFLISEKIKVVQKKYNKFIEDFKKKKQPKIVPKVPPSKPLLVKKEKIAKPVPVVKEPFKLGPFIRRNIFRFVFLLLLFVWIGESFLFITKIESREEKFKRIVGREIEKVESKTPILEKKEIAPKKEEEIPFKIERVDIEGKRDPFSTGILTMEMIKKPAPTQITLAKRPEIISILKMPKVITESTEEISQINEIPKVSTISKTSSLSQPEKLETPDISSTQLTASRLIPLSEEIKPSISPLVIPEKKCNLIYRGSLFMEGVEYMFLESEKRTYRVTVGDTIEGYKVIKKEKDKVILSKEGIMYEINL